LRRARALLPPATTREEDVSRDENRLRDELEWVLAKYDSGAVSDAVFAVVKKLETDLPWLKHQSGESQQHG
jgi:hypothetical protein